jgi:shikimate dehydrogenase
VSGVLRFAVFGHPVAHSVSPAMHTAAFKALGLPHRYDAIDVPDVDRLETMVDAVRQGVLAGANVTVPYKRAVMKMVDKLDRSAEMLGAANTLFRVGKHVVAYNTDPWGLADDLRALEAVGRTAVVIGSGGGALAAVAAAHAIGAKVVAVTSRSWNSSEALVSSETASEFRNLGALACTWPTRDERALGSSKLSEALRLQWADIALSSTLVIQATSAGMKGADPGDDVAEIVPWDRLANDVLAYDLVYNPKQTPFLRAARKRGLAFAGGLGMLVRQGAQALSLWLRVTPDIEVMQAAAEKALHARAR